MKHSIYRMNQEKKISLVAGCIPSSQNRLSEQKVFIKNIEGNDSKIGILTVDNDEKDAFYYLIDSNDKNIINNYKIKIFLEKTLVRLHSMFLMKNILMSINLII